MRIKIKSPKKEQITSYLFFGSFFITLVVTILIYLYCKLGSFSLIWKGVLASLFNDLFKDEPLLAIGLIAIIVFLFAMLPIGLWLLYKNMKEEKKNPPFIFLNFQPHGLLLENKDSRRNLLLPYEETSLSVQINIKTVRRKNNKNAAISTLVLWLQGEDTSIEIEHLDGLPFVYKILDQKRPFKKLDFSTELTSPKDTLQQEFSTHITEQINNHKMFGIHCKFSSFNRSLFFLLAIGLLFSFVCAVINCQHILLNLSFSEKPFFSFFVCLPISTLLLVAIWFFKISIKDYFVAHKINKMKGK